jgi:hypothetical protein
VAAVVFGADGRLWRLIVSGQRLYVDSSLDYGATFAQPVEVTARPQPILAHAEDRPGIAVDGKGRVYVLYAVGEVNSRTSYLSYSTDDGKAFGTPAAVNSQTQGLKYQEVMTVDHSGRLHVFWNGGTDANPTAEEKEEAALYYATADHAGLPLGSPTVLKNGMCACCRIAVQSDAAGTPILFARFVVSGGIRDHGLVKVARPGAPSESWRVTDDAWRIGACPVHGPTFSIGPADGRYHIAWFTQGDRRRGLFYASSDDRGRHFSTPMPFGDTESLAGHPSVLALDKRVVLVWIEFDGERTAVMSLRSNDGGQSWSQPLSVASAGSAADYPFLISDGKRIFLSWNSVESGHRLIAID